MVPPDSPSEIRAVGGYRILGKLGEGGMGIVYEARDPTGREVALKLLVPGQGDDPDRRRRFLREARVSASLAHPGIVRVIEVGEADGQAFIAMEKVSGSSLRRRLEHGRPLSIDETLRIARAVADAVAHAHAQGVVHRDLKPDNVMLRDSSEVCVLDFGLAKLRERPGGLVYDAPTESSVTHEGRLLGTPAYMAPEQAMGREVGFAADVFSLGVLLYEMATGTRPFDGSSSMEIIVAITRDAPERPSKRNASLGPSFDELVMRCLAKEPGERPAMAELARLLEGVDTRTTSGTTAPRPDGDERPRRRRTWGAALVLVAGVGSLVAVSVSWPRRSPGAAPDARTLTSASASAPAHTAVTDLPAPPSTNADALATYAAALAAERSGAEDAALLKLERATELDPELAAAHLRLGAALAGTEALSAREHFSKAGAFPEKLTARDRELLEALRPLLQRDPPDFDAWIAGMRQLASRYPGDAEMQSELAQAENAVGNFRESAAADRRAIEDDGLFGFAWSSLAENEAYAGDFAAARADIERCMAADPAATWCLRVRTSIDGQQGLCAAFEEGTHERMIAEPTVSDGYRERAIALASLDKPAELVQAAVTQAAERIPDPFRRHRYELLQGLRLKALAGRFDQAEGLAAELQRLVATQADEWQHAIAALSIVEIEDEVGRRAQAARLAGDFLTRREAWQPDPWAHDYSLAYDSTPALLDMRRTNGGMSDADFETAIQAWRAKWDARLRGGYRPYLWVYGWAGVVESADDARSALAALPRYSPIPAFVPNVGTILGNVGRTLALGGRLDDGLRILRAAAASCDAAVRPIPWVRAHLWLGEALEQAGDTSGACAAYGDVLARWGAAAPRSVTADRARQRSRALGCKG